MVDFTFHKPSMILKTPSQNGKIHHRIVPISESTVVKPGRDACTEPLSTS